MAQIYAMLAAVMLCSFVAGVMTARKSHGHAFAFEVFAFYMAISIIGKVSG